MGWAVALASIFHELAQEIADFLVLTGPAGNLPVVQALALNFASGLGCVLGGVVVCAAGTVRSENVGLLLAVGGGIYMYIACTECAPRFLAHAGGSPKLSLGAVVAFGLGAVAIGLVMLDHEHCDADADGGGGGGESHADHGH